MAKSKYAGVIEHLPTLPGIKPERRDVVEAVRTQMTTPPTPEEAEKSPSPELRELQVAEMLLGMEKRMELIIALQKRAVAGRVSAASSAKVYAELRDIRDHISAWDSSVGLLIEAYQWLMVDNMTNEGVSSLTLANGQPVSTWKEPYAQVENPEVYRQWCMADPDLSRKLALNWSVTNALMKERLLKGEPEPPGVTCYALVKVRLGSE